MKKKSILSTTIILLIFCVLGVAYWKFFILGDGYYSAKSEIAQDDYVSSITEDKSISFKCSEYTVEDAKYVFSKIGSPFILMPCGYEANAASKQEFEQALKDLEPLSPYESIITSIKKLCTPVEIAINDLTKKDGSAGIGMTTRYICYDGNETINAFDNEDVSDHTAYQIFKANGLSLDVKNADVLSLALNTSDHCYYALVEADVTCKENSGKYSDISWIPQVGTTEKVYFVMQFQPDSRHVNSLVIRNLEVIDQSDVAILN